MVNSLSQLERLEAISSTSRTLDKRFILDTAKQTFRRVVVVTALPTNSLGSRQTVASVHHNRAESSDANARKPIWKFLEKVLAMDLSIGTITNVAHPAWATFGRGSLCPTSAALFLRPSLRACNAILIFFRHVPPHCNPYGRSHEPAYRQNGELHAPLQGERDCRAAR